MKLVKQLSMRQFEWIPVAAEESAALADKNINKNQCRKFGQETFTKNSAQKKMVYNFPNFYSSF